MTKESLQFLKQFSNSPLFWDVEITSLETQKHKAFIIERILEFGTLEDVYWMFSEYSEKEIQEVLLLSKGLSKKSKNFWCEYYKEEGICLNKPLTKKHSMFSSR